MCGFIGFIDNDGLNHPEKTLKTMLDQISHRGPDDEGIWADKLHGLYLGFRRLSIIDLSQEGHQPMISRSGRYILCFNGEIYNHQKLRAKLNKELLSIKWRGHSDSETFLALVEAYGIKEALKHCVGMFGICCFDRKNNSLYLARDRFGEKPLYYGWSNNSFLFGSDLASFKKFKNFSNNISPHSVNLFLNYSYVPTPFSIYENIFKLEAGEVLEVPVKDTKNIRKEKFWDLKKDILDQKQNPFSSLSEAADNIEELLFKSVKAQMIADVPLGSFLSGGIDSSLITALMQKNSLKKIQTFTIGFPEKQFDESKYARDVANHLGTDHTEALLTEREALDVIPSLPSIYSEPFADSSQIPTFLVSKIAKQSITVALSGDGGDELFCGYNRYFWGEKIWNKIALIPFPLRSLIGAASLKIPPKVLHQIEAISSAGLKSNGVSFLSDKVQKLANRLVFIRNNLGLYNSLATQWNGLNDVVKNDSPSSQNPFIELSIEKDLSFIENMMYWDLISYMKDDILVKVDRAAMANSLETRAPFLNHKLASASFRLRGNCLNHGTKGKIVLRKILNKYVPDQLIDRPKTGFGIPIGSWINSELKDWASSYINKDVIEAQGLLKYDEVEKIWNQHQSGYIDNTVKLWNILILTSWVHQNNI